MIKKTLKGILWLTLIVVFVLLSLFAYIAGTNHGLRQVLSLGKSHAPGTLEWQRVDGHLLDKLRLENFSYEQDNGLRVSLDETTFAWSPTHLFSGKLDINQLLVRNLELHLPEPSADAPEPEPAGEFSLPEIRLPLSISLEDIALDSIKIYPYGSEEPIHIEQVQLQGSAEDDTVQLLNLQVNAPDAEVKLGGSIHPVADYAMDITTAWRYKHAEFGAFSGEGTVKGDLQALAIKHAAEGPVDLTLESTLQTLLDNPAWKANINAMSGDLGQFNASLTDTPLKLSVLSEGNLDNFNASANLLSDLKETGPLAIDVNAQGNTQRIRLEDAIIQLLSRPGKIKLAGDIDIEKQVVDLAGGWESLSWPLIGDTAMVETPQGALTIKGGAADFATSLEAILTSDQFGTINSNLVATGNDEKVQLQTLKIASPDSDIQLDANAEFIVAEQRFNAQGNWQSLAWPLQGEATVVSPNGEFTAEGLLSDYTFSLLAKVEGKDIPKSQWDIQAAGSDKELDQLALNSQLLGGTLKADGDVKWLPELAWDLSVNAEGIDPSEQWAELPGNISMALKTSGSVQDNTPRVLAVIQSLTGTLRQQALNGKGKIEIEGEEITVDHLNIANGPSRIAANGVIGKRWNLDFEVKSPDLSSLAPDIQGALTADGKLTGSASEPSAKAKLFINNLQAGSNKIGELRSTIDVDIAGNKSSSITLQGSQLEVGGSEWSSLDLQGSGKPNQHQLSLKLNGSLAKLRTALKGGLKKDTWNGQLTTLSALDTEFGDWKLRQAAAISANADRATAKPICLLSEPSEICLAGNWDKVKGSSGKLQLSGLRPERFAHYLPPGISLDTALNGEAVGKINSRGVIDANADFTIEKGAIVVESDADPVTIDIDESKLQAALKGDKANTTVDLGLGEFGSLQSKMRINNVMKSPILDGLITSNMPGLHLLSAFVPQLQEVKGALVSDLTIKGEPATPSINGFIELQNFEAEVPEFALEIKDTYFTARSDAEKGLLLEGASRSGEGNLTISGHLDPATRTLALDIAGADYQVSNSEQIRARISPNLAIKMANDGMSVNGEVVIPSAYINANGGTGGIQTVAASSDVVFIEEEGEAVIEEKEPANINLDVRVELGDDINVEAGDFRGGLTGNLQVKQTPGVAPTGTGTIEVSNGDYVIYGQQLNIQRGRILFGGGPVDNPQLDMDVARNVEAYEVVAGARIRGTAQAPILQLYSEPSMPDASILSFILLGQPPGTKGGSYTVGKYLTPDLYVSYGIGLFNAINTFNMRYKLTDTLALQAASSTASSADIVYTIER